MDDMAYIVLHNADVDELANHVTVWMAKGYVPHDSLVIQYKRGEAIGFMQPMVRYVAPQK